jgi:iron complex outermembrane receptor protein
VILTSIHRWSTALLLTLCAVLLSGAPQSLLAQSTGLTLAGTIMDAKGGVLPNAAITIKNESTGVVHTNKTDAQGRFSESGLTAGRYTV